MTRIDRFVCGCLWYNGARDTWQVISAHHGQHDLVHGSVVEIGAIMGQTIRAVLIRSEVDGWSWLIDRVVPEIRQGQQVITRVSVPVDAA